MSRIKELTVSKIKLVITMFFITVYYSISADYVPCDSWFTCDELITAVRSQKCHLIGIYKFVKTKLEFKGKLLSFRDILHLTGKEKHCKKCIMNDTEAAKWVNHLLEISYREIG